MAILDLDGGELDRRQQSLRRLLPAECGDAQIETAIGRHPAIIELTLVDEFAGVRGGDQSGQQGGQQQRRASSWERHGFFSLENIWNSR
ncbi:MAG: hypothetical protein DYH17_15745 [Xanthomonadales bacterium PRO6]|nr:hypothetical protein [Xanthomonadales bacterium PRO6]